MNAATPSRIENWMSNGESVMNPIASMPIVMNTNMIEPTRNSALKYWAKFPTVIVRMRVTSAFHGSGTCV